MNTELDQLLSRVEAVNAAQEAGGGKIGLKVIEAVSWLQEYLTPGPKPATGVYTAAANCGHSKRTIRRAKSVLKICSRLEYNLAEYKSRWMWSCPKRECGGL